MQNNNQQYWWGAPAPARAPVPAPNMNTTLSYGDTFVDLRPTGGAIPSYLEFARHRTVSSLFGGDSSPPDPAPYTNPNAYVPGRANIHWHRLDDTPTQPFEDYWEWIRGRAVDRHGLETPTPADPEGKVPITSKWLLDQLFEMTPEMIADPTNGRLRGQDGMTLSTLKKLKSILLPRVRGRHPLSCEELVATACALWIVHPNAVSERGHPAQPVERQVMPDGSACHFNKDIPRRVAFEVVHRIAPDIIIPKHLCNNCRSQGKSACYILSTINRTRCFACKGNCSHYVPRS